MSTWPSPRARLLKNMCSRTKSQLRNLLLVGKGAKTTTIFCQDYIGDANRRPTRKSESKGESTMEYKLGMITKG
jgi:hypothetical protein